MFLLGLRSTNTNPGLLEAQLRFHFDLIICNCKMIYLQKHRCTLARAQGNRNHSWYMAYPPFFYSICIFILISVNNVFGVQSLAA